MMVRHGISSFNMLIQMRFPRFGFLEAKAAGVIE
jgi:hypothetical protein